MKTTDAIVGILRQYWPESGGQAQWRHEEYQRRAAAEAIVAEVTK